MARRKSKRAVARKGVASRGIAAETAEIDVDDPHATRKGQKIRVQRQLRGDPLARLHSHNQIDEAQYRAGRAYQRDVETAERFVRSLDLTRERVDGGVTAEPLTDAQVRARKRLTELKHALGRTMHRVTHAVLVERLSMETVAQRVFNREGELSVRYYGRLFRDALDVLAGEYGLTRRGRLPQDSA